jgi:hypothetical protein
MHQLTEDGLYDRNMYQLINKYVNKPLYTVAVQTELLVFSPVNRHSTNVTYPSRRWPWPGNTLSHPMSLTRHLAGYRVRKFPSGMWRRVICKKFIAVSEEHFDSVFRVEKCAKQAGSAQFAAFLHNFLVNPEYPGRVFLRNVGKRLADYTVSIRDESILESHSRENLKPHLVLLPWLTCPVKASSNMGQFTENSQTN